MTQKFKNRTFRKVQVKLADRTTVHYKKRNPSPAKCGECKKVLQAVPRGRPVDMRNLAKTKKRPERPYGGVLCSKCMRAMMVAKARA